MGGEADRSVRAGTRARVHTVPGLCSQWSEEEADLSREVLDLVGDKWSVLIIGTLAAGPARYSDLANEVPGISQRMLTLTLKQLRRSGLLTRTAYPEVPPRVEYALTDLGTSLLSTVLDLVRWSAEHRERVRSHQTAFDSAESSPLD